jgi:hypothetical protein
MGESRYVQKAGAQMSMLTSFNTPYSTICTNQGKLEATKTLIYLIFNATKTL